MKKILSEIKTRVIDSPASTLAGTAVGLLNLLLHMLAVNIDWTQTRQVVTTAIGTVVPMVVGALAKKAKSNNPLAEEVTQKIAESITNAAQQAALAATDKVISEIQRIATAQPPPIKEEEAHV